MAKAKRKGRKGRQAKLSKGKKRGAKKAAKRKGAKKKKVAKQKASPKPRISHAVTSTAFTEIAPEETTPSVPDTSEEPMMGSTESTESGDTGFSSTEDNSNM